MIPLEYILDILTNYRFLYIYLAVSLLIILINRILIKRTVNGLLILNFTSSIVFSIILDLYIRNFIGIQKLLFFTLSEVFFYFTVIFTYKYLIEKSDKEKLKLALVNFNEKYFNLLVLFILISIFINLIFVSHDGTSRIAFNVNRWYSFVRLMNTLTKPVLAFLLFYNIEVKNKKKYIFIFALIITESITSGSRSGFLFFLVGYFLIYRDIFRSKIFSNRLSLVASTIILIFASYLTLKYNNFDGPKVFERLMHYGESTIMVYPLDNPSSIVKGHSIISLVHRGFGRLLGDPTSMNIDSLFGFALSAEFYGSNTLTGPNARIGSYALCAFPGFKLILLYIIFIVFLKLCFYLLKISKQISSKFYLISLLLIIDGIQEFILDYNTGISVLTVILILIFFRAIYKLIFLNTATPAENKGNLNLSNA